MNKRIPLATPHMSDEGYELEYIHDAFEKNWIAPLGENVNKFEEGVARYVGIKSAVALSSGTHALHMALKCLDIKDDDEVFCSSLTFSATANPILYERAIPVFIDSEPNSLNMSPIALEKALQERKPKAVIVVHLYGQSADMDPIMELCKKYNVAVIEDAAESLGATYKGKQTGTIGDFGIYSFNGNKIITTSGGGMLVSNNEEAINKTLFWSTQARESKRYYYHKELGYNYRMSNIVAGIGRGQLKVLDQRIEKKKEIFNIYKKELEEVSEIKMETVCNYGNPNYWLSTMFIDESSNIKPLNVIEALEKENIEARHIWRPMHIQPIFEGYKFFNHNEDGISVSEDIFNRGVCLPSDTKMTDEDIKRVTKVIKSLF